MALRVVSRWAKDIYGMAGADPSEPPTIAVLARVLLGRAWARLNDGKLPPPGALLTPVAATWRSPEGFVVLVESGLSAPQESLAVAHALGEWAARVGVCPPQAATMLPALARALLLPEEALERAVAAGWRLAEIARFYGYPRELVAGELLALRGAQLHKGGRPSCLFAPYKVG